MKILIVSSELIGASLCHRLIAENHDIKLYIDKPEWKECLENIIPKTNNWEKELTWVGKDGLIIFDDVGFGEEQDNLRKQGYTVVGGSAGADELELNRELFQNLLKSYAIPILPSYDFKNIDDAIDFIKKNPDQWVVKQNAHFGVLNYVGERNDGKDSIGVLNSYRNYNIKATHLQKRVRGIEIGVARYFNGLDWVGPIEINHEHKRLYNDDVGPLTHEMGTIMWYSDDEKLPLFEKTLSKLKPYLQKIDFRGDIDINCIVNKEGIWPLEATPRFGNPSTPLQCELNKSDWSEFLHAVASKQSYDLRYKDTFGIVVCIALPPFPYLPMFTGNKANLENTILSFKENFSEDDWKHIHLEEISLKKEGGVNTYHWTGTDGWVMHITAEDKDISKAQEKVYSLINKIILPNMFYRTDIGTRVKNHDLLQLKKWGWI